jgi:hypothetical protein
MAVVCWSGGVDSTLVLYDLALEAKNGRGCKHGVRALTIVQPQVPCQPQGALARAALKVRFRELGLRFDHAVLTMRVSGRFYPTSVGSGLVQPLFWVGSAVNYLAGDEDLYLGYVHGDCIWHYIGHLRAAFTGLLGVSGRSGNLVMPLEWSRKAEVIERAQGLGLYEQCWWCEGDQDKLVRLPRGRLGPCGECPACKTHKTGLWQLEMGLFKSSEGGEGKVST